MLKLGYNDMPCEGSIWPRIWWCPTGIISFLPVHAAGYHNDTQTPNRTVIDRVISAYTSTVRALKNSRENASSTAHKALIAIMPTTPGLARLRAAKDEGYRVRKILLEQGKVDDVLVTEWPTVETIQNALPNRDIAHFVCHAASDCDPSLSRLLFKDGDLKVVEISEMKLKGGALAYLSACSTAFSRGDKLEDEGIVFTSAFQVAGFSRVVGTLWEAEDRVSFQVAQSFYQSLNNDPSRAAEALHWAIRQQRVIYNSEPSLWAPYICTGA